jgi:endoglucanase
MHRLLLLLAFTLSTLSSFSQASWIRINQLGYTPGGIKIAVWGSKSNATIRSFQLIEASSKKVVYTASAGKSFGSYGPFRQTHRLHFSAFKKAGRYYLQVGSIRSPEFRIADDVYKGSADFCLRYMRQQRTGFNPYLKDSCHTQDGYTLYGQKGGLKDSTRIDVVGGWHDASDYLQYSTTSANATYHLLMAYRDFPQVFSDEKQANGLDGKNGMADVLDEAKWGLNWLLKMHPKPDWLFNQIADDRDHMGMRMPKEDSFYGRKFQRPVYFVSGEPQQRGKFMNNTTGTSSIAGKFASAFALGASIFEQSDKDYYSLLSEKSRTAFLYGFKKLGVSQTASVRSPYIYAEDNWVDDMELAAAAIYKQQKKEGSKVAPETLNMARSFAALEPVTPWLGADTAKHYQWYPFINVGHYELAKQVNGKLRDSISGYYREGIQKVWSKAKQNAFYRGVPFIWCSNNLTTSFAIQCYWYRDLTGDSTFSELEQANFDWLFGCNPWGTSMVYGLPSWGDTPVDPHSAFTHIKKYPIDGGLVDGPVYGSIYKGLIGITLYQPDEYENFQSQLAVYHDDYGDYSTNEPTMDGTASLIYLLAAKENEASSKSFPTDESSKPGRPNFSYSFGGIVRGDSSRKNIALVFTGDEFADGGELILKTLKEENVKASFFFTGRFYRNPVFRSLITQIKIGGHYLGAHSDQHLLYNDWNRRDSLLVSEKKFGTDIDANYMAMNSFGIRKKDAPYFLPPYEWYNDSISSWTKKKGFELVNYTPGTRSTSDYTWPELKNYQGSESIYRSIVNYEKSKPMGLNGFLLLLHIGTDPKRTDKFYPRLPELVTFLRGKGYDFQRVDELLRTD